MDRSPRLLEGNRRRVLTLRRLAFAIALAGTVVTLVVGFAPAIWFAREAPSLSVLLETTAGLISLLAAYLVFGRFRARNRLDDLVLCCALVALSASSLFFSSLPTALDLDTDGFRIGTDRFTTWAPLIGRLLGASLLATAAFAPARRIRRKRAVARAFFGAVALMLATIGLLVALFAERLPQGVGTAFSSEALGRPHIYGHSAVLAVHLALTGLYALAAVGFTIRSERTRDEFLAWFAIGSILASVAAAHHFLFPSLYSRWIYSGDLIRLLSKLVLLAGAAREIGRYWRSLADVAVLEERRRIARDLHDGLAQELAFILRRARRADADDAFASRVAAAAERALADARRAIAALTQPLGEPLDLAIAQAVGEVAERFEQRLVLDLVPNVSVDAAVREELVRIAREAVTNAARHAHASIVRVELSNRDRVRLTIADDGIGFDVDPAAREERFGLVGMRERAHALNADFQLASVPGGGTVIEVTVP